MVVVAVAREKSPEKVLGGGCRSDIRTTYIKINGRSSLRYSLLHQAALPGVSSSDSKLPGLRPVGEFLLFRRIGVE